MYNTCIACERYCHTTISKLCIVNQFLMGHKARGEFCFLFFTFNTHPSELQSRMYSCNFHCQFPSISCSYLFFSHSVLILKYYNSIITFHQQEHACVFESGGGLGSWMLICTLYFSPRGNWALQDEFLRAKKASEKNAGEEFMWIVFSQGRQKEKSKTWEQEGEKGNGLKTKLKMGFRC